MNCVNENCNNDPINSIKGIIINIDGDMACCLKCKKEYEKQQKYFLNVILQSEELTINYIKGK